MLEQFKKFTNWLEQNEITENNINELYKYILTSCTNVTDRHCNYIATLAPTMEEACSKYCKWWYLCANNKNNKTINNVHYVYVLMLIYLKRHAPKNVNIKKLNYYRQLLLRNIDQAHKAYKLMERN